jgi:hypothetical protein
MPSEGISKYDSKGWCWRRPSSKYRIQVPLNVAFRYFMKLVSPAFERSFLVHWVEPDMRGVMDSSDFSGYLVRVIL